MSNKSIIDEAIQQMQQKKVDSLGKRTGDYRIGLYDAINIFENLREMHKKEIIEVWIDAYTTNMKCPTRDNFILWAENYYNETFGGNK